MLLEMKANVAKDIIKPINLGKQLGQTWKEQYKWTNSSHRSTKLLLNFNQRPKQGEGYLRAKHNQQPSPNLTLSPQLSNLHQPSTHNHRLMQVKFRPFKLLASQTDSSYWEEGGKLKTEHNQPLTT